MRCSKRFIGELGQGLGLFGVDEIQAVPPASCSVSKSRVTQDCLRIDRETNLILAVFEWSMGASQICYSQMRASQMCASQMCSS